MDGIKHVLGIWIQATEGAKFWAGVCAELANRGVKDVLIVLGVPPAIAKRAGECDGLSGFPEPIEVTWPESTVQTCVVRYAHLRIMPMSSAVHLRGRDSGLPWSA